MSSSQTVSSEARPRARRRNFNPLRALKRLLPRGLFGRSLIIIVAPVVLLQAIVTYVFFERHYDIVTTRMARNVAGDVAFLITLENSLPAGAQREQARTLAAKNLGYTVLLLPGEHLAPSKPQRHNALDHALSRVLAMQISEPVNFDTQRYPHFVDIRVQIKDGVLRLLVPLDRVTASNADIFILWMIGSSLVLLAVAILFLRNQVKPIEHLALVAENFGKGRAVPDFKPHGAMEVRRAAQAFIQMRERIERHVQQRTEMLAGVSHDLKTPLTRLRLQLAMMRNDPDTEAMTSDLVEMEHMLDEYLDFARGEGGEAAEPTDLSQFLEEAVADADRARTNARARIKFVAPEGLTLAVKRKALKRCLVNLIDNALKYADEVEVTARRGTRAVDLCVEDNGPGIPEDRREEAFRPFHRLDESRNLQRGGVGLGLAIARDIARSHGGDVVLEQSPLGGLKAIIRLPV
jgi:two-component system, OmpR family, osmolarity sensor histidine kinase EnvZ